jgi:hypothetical protein
MHAYSLRLFLIPIAILRKQAGQCAASQAPVGGTLCTSFGPLLPLAWTSWRRDAVCHEGDRPGLLGRAVQKLRPAMLWW